MTETELIPGAVGAGGCQLSPDRPMRTAATGAALFSAGGAPVQAQVGELLHPVAGNRQPPGGECSSGVDHWS
jgi:hypothetical protein